MDTHIKRLRSSLEEYRSCIVTLRGVGYRFDDHIFELLTKNGELPEKPTGDGNEAGQSPQNENTGNGVSLDQTPPSGIAQESMVSVRILTISSTPYLTIVSARLTPVNATVQMIRQELI